MTTKTNIDRSLSLPLKWSYIQIDSHCSFSSCAFWERQPFIIMSMTFPRGIQWIDDRRVKPLEWSFQIDAERSDYCSFKFYGEMGCWFLLTYTKCLDQLPNPDQVQ